MSLRNSMSIARAIPWLALVGWIVGVCTVVAVTAAEIPGEKEAGGTAVGTAAPTVPQGPVETITGTVVRARRSRGRAGAARRPVPIRGRQFLLQTAKETVTVRVGPYPYRRRQGFEIRADDQLEVKGWRLGTPGRAIMLAGEIRKESRVLKIRDDSGRPLWLIRGPLRRSPGRRPQVTPPSAALEKSGTSSKTADDVE